MTWNKAKIEASLDELKHQLETTQNIELLDCLKYDYKVLLEILKTIDIKAYKYFLGLISNLYIDLIPYYKNFSNFSAECLLENKAMLCALARNSESYLYRYPKGVYKKKISEEKYLQMVRKFLQSYDLGHYELFEKLSCGNIHFARNKREMGNSRGKCYTTSIAKESYIITDFYLKNNVETLPHEIAHAYEFSRMSTFDEKIKWHYSTFCECYPRFLELAFLDYFEDSEYEKFFLEKKRQLFDNLKASSEYFLTYIRHMSKFDYSTGTIEGCTMGKVAKHQIDLIIADFLAIYMFNLYKNDRNKFSELIERFHSFKGKSDEGIWELFDVQELQNAFFEESRKFNHDVIISRKRSRSSTFQV